MQDKNRDFVTLSEAVVTEASLKNTGHIFLVSALQCPAVSCLLLPQACDVFGPGDPVPVLVCVCV